MMSPAPVDGAHRAAVSASEAAAPGASATFQVGDIEGRVERAPMCFLCASFLSE